METTAGTRFLGDFDRALLSQIEDAGLNASAPPQQLWMDGWLVRLSPGKAQRARCINAVCAGHVPLQSKLDDCRRLYAERGLPMLLRVTPFTQPPDLDAYLARAGWQAFEETCVMVMTRPSAADRSSDAVIDEVSPEDYADIVGALRGTAPSARAAHAERLRTSPVPYRAFVARAGDAVLAGGQMASEGERVGLYDIYTAEAARGRGLARQLCEHLLSAAVKSGATTAYLQVGADNAVARRLYQRLGFRDAYTYHYRRPAP